MVISTLYIYATGEEHARDATGTGIGCESQLAQHGRGGSHASHQKHTSCEYTFNVLVG